MPLEIFGPLSRAHFAPLIPNVWFWCSSWYRAPNRHGNASKYNEVLRPGYSNPWTPKVAKFLSFHLPCGSAHWVCHQGNATTLGNHVRISLGQGHSPRSCKNVTDTHPFAPQSWTVVLKLQDWSHSHSYFTETLLIRLKQSCLDSGKWEDSFSRIFLLRESNMLFFHPRKLFAWNQDTWLSLSLQLCNLGYLRHVK